MHTALIAELVQLVRTGALDSLVDEYTRLLETIDARVAELKQAGEVELACTPGCCDCCNGFFEVSLLDAVLILAHLEEEPATNDELAQARWFSEAADDAGWRYPHLLGNLEDEAMLDTLDNYDNAPCPFLQADGFCRIYRSRPSICRFQGLIMEDPDSGIKLDDDCPKTPDGSDVVSFPLIEFDYAEDAIFGMLTTFIDELEEAPLSDWDTLIAAVPIWHERMGAPIDETD